MSEIRKKYDEEFKKNAVKLSYASPKTVAQVAKDLSVAENLMYTWRKKYTSDGDKTRWAAQDEEMKALRLEVAELRMERDMLKKATAYPGFERRVLGVQNSQTCTSSLRFHKRPRGLPCGEMVRIFTGIPERLLFV